MILVAILFYCCYSNTMGHSILSKGNFNNRADPGIKNHRKKHMFVLLIINFNRSLVGNSLKICIRDTFSKEKLIQIIFLW